MLALLAPAVRAEALWIDADSVRAADGATLPLREWLPPGPPHAIVLALHGFGDYSAAFRMPGEFWAKAGLATFAYDQRGFGGAPHVYRWAGTAAMAGDALDVAAALRRRYPGVPLYLLGESMGGAVAVAATAGRSSAEMESAGVSGVILVSPAVWEHDFLGAVERSALWVTNLTIPNLWLEPPRGLNIWPSDNVPMLRALAQDSLVWKGARADAVAGLMDLMDRAQADAPRLRLPVLALFGQHDQVLPKSAIDTFIARLPASARVAAYPEGYHMLLRDLDGETVWKDILAWIENPAAPLPSGDACRGLAAPAKSCKGE
jgi:alpha-beta hydrolase superfamily lysophospholipase